MFDLFVQGNKRRHLLLYDVDGETPGLESSKRKLRQKTPEHGDRTNGKGRSGGAVDRSRWSYTDVHKVLNRV